MSGALTTGDWLVVAGYLVVSAVIALVYHSRSSKDTGEFFLSGRNLPWWLAGTSMVATTFAADTPLAVTELVAKHGIAGNWLWWSQCFSGLLTVFFFAKLWRRAGVMTDVEFAEIRYSGKPAAFLRVFRALYLALPVNLIIMGWVNLAMVTVAKVSLGWDPEKVVWLCFAITAAYTMISGFWGVVVTDFFQFAFAMAGCVVLAFYAVGHVGGLDALIAASQTTGPDGGTALGFMPPKDAAWMPMITFATYLGVSWWASWYPGAEPGGGGYVAQRLFAAKNDAHAAASALWFTIAHYALRPWPWVLVALVSLIMFPGLQNTGEGFPRVMMAVLPSPLKGFLLAAFLAAYMSTISTHLNWGSSYMVEDVYRRFIRPKAPASHYVNAARLCSLVMAALSFLVTRKLSTVAGAWQLLISVGAGCGAVYILRWYWWRVNAWSEVSAMAAAAIVSLILRHPSIGLSADDPRQYAYLLLLTTACTTAVWVTVTLLTRPERRDVLEAFYRRVAPAPEGWGDIPRTAGKTEQKNIDLKSSALAWALGCVLVYCALLSTGKLLFGASGQGLALLALGAASAAGLYRLRNSL